MSYKENPKTKGSGIVCAIPQSGTCPMGCADCFFQSGRSYLEPLSENLPNVPDAETAHNRVVRMNDGNDSAHEMEKVIKCANKYQFAFYNTSCHNLVSELPGPTVLTINPAGITDSDFNELRPIPRNLMFVRFRANTWNVDLLDAAVGFYTGRDIPLIVTWMAYYSQPIPDACSKYYEWAKRTTNPYWVIRRETAKQIMDDYADNPYVYECGYKGTHQCGRCGNCLREYFATMERLRHE